MPAGFRLVPSNNNNNNLFPPQILAKSSSVGTFTPQTILAPTNIMGQSQPSSPPQQPIINPSSLPQQQQATPSVAATAPAFQHAQHIGHQQPPQQQQRQFPNYQDSPFQYIPPPPQYNLQQVQFVPCMCPVTLGLNPEPYSTPLSAENRVDDAMTNHNPMDMQPQPLMEASADTRT